MTDRPHHGHESDEALDTFAARIARPLRAAEPPDPALRERVLASIRAGREQDVAPVVALEPRRRPRAVPAAPPAEPRPAWWRRGITVRVTPVGALALAASVAAVAVLGAGPGRGGALGERPAAGAALASAPTPRPDTVHVVRFVFVAPAASAVTVAGDFNNWDGAATRLTRAGSGGVWTATVALPAGRHEYAFVVDGVRWVADPRAGTTVEDEFGGASSVVTVGASAARSL